MPRCQQLVTRWHLAKAALNRDWADSGEETKSITGWRTMGSLRLSELASPVLRETQGRNEEEFSGCKSCLAWETGLSSVGFSPTLVSD